MYLNPMAVILFWKMVKTWGFKIKKDGLLERLGLKSFAILCG